MAPFGPTEKGNLKPMPRKLLMRFPMPGRLCAGDSHFHHALAVGAGHDGATLPFLDVEPVGAVALGTHEAGGAARVDRLDPLVPDRFDGGHPLFDGLVHVPHSPLVDAPA